MNNFFYKIERVIVNLLIICLILLISSQLIIKNDRAKNNFEKIKMTFQEIVLPEKDTLEVSNNYTEDSGIIVIDLIQNKSKPHIWLLINGKKVSNFSHGRVFLKVHDGDLLTIDARKCPEILWYKISSISPTILSFEKGNKFRSSGNTVSLGIVKITKNKV